MCYVRTFDRRCRHVATRHHAKVIKFALVYRMVASNSCGPPILGSYVGKRADVFVCIHLQRDGIRIFEHCGREDVRWRTHEHSPSYVFTVGCHATACPILVFAATLARRILGSCLSSPLSLLPRDGVCHSLPVHVVCIAFPRRTSRRGLHG